MLALLIRGTVKSSTARVRSDFPSKAIPSARIWQWAKYSSRAAMSSLVRMRQKFVNAFWYRPFFISLLVEFYVSLCVILGRADKLVTHQRGLSTQNQTNIASGTAGAKAAANWKRHARGPMSLKTRLDEKPNMIPKATQSWNEVTMPPRIDAGDTWRRSATAACSLKIDP